MRAAIRSGGWVAIVLAVALCVPSRPARAATPARTFT